MLSGRDVFLRILVEELGIPKLAEIFAYGTCRTLLYTARQIWTKDV